MTALSVVLGVALAAALGLTVAGLRTSPMRDRSGPRRSAAALRLRRWSWLQPLMLGLVVGGVVGWASGWPVAAVAAGLGAVLVPRAVAQPGNRSMITTLEAVAEWTRRLADLLGTGAGGLEAAITASAHTAPAAIAEQVQALAASTRVGGLDPALWEFARQLDHAAAHRVVACLILRHRSGGRGLIPILNELASSLRQDVAGRRQVEADRAKIRTSVRALLAIITAMTIGLLAATEDYLAPFDTLTGQLWLALVFGLIALACTWLAALTRPRPEPGFLLHPQPSSSTARGWWS
ncbi:MULTISPECIES: type II secretion system F family protein [unclassified Crossiella]|uniref:type II secretion system F family protein n=1 Tax=unclassified Crossiella TaxID=2620835 RepID=UPI002000224C|nr:MULTISPECIES: pilus assembly protein TadB [unclassified Crossiella]MCK2243694.1 pilus assembly protein TadB [Crossiella sp. S99.2]MCK2257553.1 pilus assembly protein TadB [Crossiella sp. S99.1]